MIELKCPGCQKRIITEDFVEYQEGGNQMKDLHFECNDCLINIIVTLKGEIVPDVLNTYHNNLGNEQLQCPICKVELRIINYDIYDEVEGTYFEERDCVMCNLLLNKIIMP